VLASVSGRCVRCAARCGRRDGRRPHDVRIGCGSGRRSRGACRARTRRPRRACPRRSGRGGSVRLAGCRRSRWLRPRAATCPSLSGKTSQSSTPGVAGSARSLDGSAGRRPRSRGSFAATPRLARIASSTGHRRHSGTPSDVPAARRSPNSPRTNDFVSTCKTAWRGGSPGPTASWWRAPMWPGSVVDTGAARTAVGRGRGARSRSRTDCGLTSLRTRRCGSRTRRSIRRCTCKAAVRCAGT
jgi:hypothetical protein